MASRALPTQTGEPVLLRMLAASRHRGPDDSGTAWFGEDRRIGLTSARLAVLDLSLSGHMPMIDPLTGNAIVYNGEVYNFRELREELKRQGETFVSETDTEVVLKSYGRWKADCLCRFRGMFAFAIWDAPCERQLFLARDRMGVKPLYYARLPSGTFLFASEVRALLASDLNPRRLHPPALEGYLFNGFVVSPLTIIEGLSSLLPGHFMRVDQHGQILARSAFWNLSASPATPSSRDRLDLAREALQEAVRCRLLSDVPLGAFLSGGLDSSSIVAGMGSGASHARTFSVGFRERDYDESSFAAWVATRFETQHAAIQLSETDFISGLPDALDAIDQPTFDGINTYFVSRVAKKSGLTVALSGIGGDEVFGGYPFFRTIPWIGRLFRAVARLPGSGFGGPISRTAGRMSRLSGPWKIMELLYSKGTRPDSLLAAYQASQLQFPHRFRRRLLRSDLLIDEESLAFGLPLAFCEFLKADEGADDTPMDCLCKLALRIFLGERCLKDTDMMSMGVSLEVRAPFTDHHYLAAAMSIPSSIRCRGIPDKPCEWEMAKPMLGKDYPYRRKQGFVFPFPPVAPGA